MLRPALSARPELPPRTRAGALALALLCAAVGCKEEAPPAASPIALRVTEARHTTDAAGQPVLELTLTARNRGQSPAEVRAFVLAENPAPRPPTRAIWPPGATGELENSYGGLVVARPELGARIALGVGTSTVHRVVVPVPGGRSRFRQVLVQAFGPDGTAYAPRLDAIPEGM